MIAQSSIDEIMQRTDIVDVVGQFVRLKKRGTNHIANCPFHSEKTPSFYVSGSKGIFKCFGCGKGGNAVTFIQEHEKLTYPESIHWLADFYKIDIEETERSPEQKEQQKSEETLRLLNEFAAKYFHDQLFHDEEGIAIGLSYFKQRGFRKEIIERFNLGYNREDGHSFFTKAVQSGYDKEILLKAGLISHRGELYYDMYRGRVIFPIQNMTGRVLGFGARILKKNDKAPKYINTPENELYIKSRTLYGMFQSRQAISKANECFLVEGYTDVVSMHQGGVENVLASSGTSLTEDQLRVIGQLTKNLTILYDGDAAGIKAALRGMDMALAQSFNVKLVLFPEGEDPDSFIQQHGATVFQEYAQKKKQDVISFRLEVGLKEAGTDPVAKSKLVNEIAESISRINKAEDFALRDYYLRESAKKLQVDEAGLINLVNKFIRERMEQERRTQARQESVSAAPEIAGDGTESIAIAGKLNTASNEERKEWEVIRVLLEHGHKAYEGEENVAALIFERIDPELIENAMARSVFNSYFAFLKKFGSVPGLDYFTNIPDAALQEKMANLLQTKSEISPNWSIVYNIETMHGEHNYINEVDSALQYYEVQKIIVILETVCQRMEQERDAHKTTLLQQKLMDLKLAQKEFFGKSDTVIFKLQPSNRS